MSSSSAASDSRRSILGDTKPVRRFSEAPELASSPLSVTVSRAARRLWKDYFTTVDGVVFMVDALDRQRFPESKQELDVRNARPSVFACTVLILRRCPRCSICSRAMSSKMFRSLFLVTRSMVRNTRAPQRGLSPAVAHARAVLAVVSTLAARNAASEDDLRYALGLFETYGKDNKGERDTNVRPIEVFMCSVIRKMGYADGFRWLAQFF